MGTVTVHGLQVARVLHDFVTNEALPGIGLEADQFRLSRAGGEADAAEPSPSGRARPTAGGR